MKTLVVLLAAVAFVAAIDKYPTKFDNINLDNIINNKRLMDSYVNCLIGKGKCNEDGTTLKSVIPDALVTNCSKCNNIQKAGVEKVVKHLVKNRRNDWNALIAFYDPTGKYQKQYAHYIKEI